MAAHERDRSIVSSASYLIALQAGSRLVTFALNQALLRLATPQAFGTVAIQLELLLNTILFFSREGVRNAAIRTDRKALEEDPARRGQLLRTTLLPVLVGLPLSIAGCLLYVTTAGPAVAAQEHFRAVVAVYGLAALVELASEPLFVLAQLDARQDLRLRAEGAAVVVRAVVTVGLLARAGETLALVAFAAGQLGYAAVLLLAYGAAYGRTAARDWQGCAGFLTVIPLPQRLRQQSFQRDARLDAAARMGANQAVPGQAVPARGRQAGRLAPQHDQRSGRIRGRAELR
jgi:oligosaccharide translocation protein RFT1